MLTNLILFEQRDQAQKSPTHSYPAARLALVLDRVVDRRRHVVGEQAKHGAQLLCKLALRIPRQMENLPRELPFMTSAKFSDFLTPSPLVRIFTQPPLLASLT